MASQLDISRRVALLSAALTLAGCGGGGDAGSGGTPATSEESPPPAPSASSQAWGTAVEVRRASLGGNSGALLADGSVLMLSGFVFMDPEVLSAVRIDANGSLGSPMTVTSFVNPFNGRPHFHDSTVVAATADGAFIAWREPIPNGRNSDEYERLQICRYRASGGLQAPVSIAASAGSVVTYSLTSMSGDGALLAWIETAPEDPLVSPRGPTSLYVATYTDATGWSSPVRLTTSTPDQPISLSSVATGASVGHVAVLWAQKNGADWGHTLLASTRAPGGTWTTPAMVYATNDVERSTCTYLAIAPDSLGNAMAVWEYTSWDMAVHRSAFNRFTTGGGWLGAQDISRWAVTPSVAVNSRGQGLLAWSDDGVVYGADFGLAGFGAVKALSLQDAGWTPQASVGDDGRGVVFWEQIVFNHGEHVAVYGASFGPGARWSNPSNASPLPEVARLSDVTNMRGGRGAVIWNQGDISALQSSYWLAPFEVRAA